MSGHMVLLMLHVLGATVWTGGHLVLALSVLPRAWKAKSTEIIAAFEDDFERVGIPALVLQVVTGVWLALDFLPFALWFELSNPMARTVLLKLALLTVTLVLAADARLRIIPKLTPERISSLAAHIIPVTVIGVLFALLGVLLRAGGL